MKLLKGFYLFFLFLFPLGELGRVQLTADIAVRIHDVFLLLLVTIALLLFKQQLLKEQRQISIAFFLFIGVCVVSLLVNSFLYTPQEILVGFLYLIRWMLYVSLFFITVQFDQTFKATVRKTLIIIGSIIVGLGYLQYFFYNDLRNLFYLGWDEHLYRLFATFLDPNFAGAFFVLFLLVLLAHFFLGLQTKNKSMVILASSGLVLTTIALLLTYSRSALIMFFISVFTYLLLLRKGRWITLVIGMLTIFFIFASQNFAIENLNLLRTASSEARIQSANTALQIFQKQPILGVGFNTYRYAQIRFGYREAHPKIVSHADAGTDNSFLFVLATTGILGLGAYLFLWLRILQTLQKKVKQQKKDFHYFLSRAVFASIIGIFVNSLFINSLFYSFLMGWLWIVTALAVSEKHDT